MINGFRVVAGVLMVISLLSSNAIADSRSVAAQNTIGTHSTTVDPVLQEGSFMKVRVPLNLLKQRVNVGSFKALAAAQRYTFVELLNAPSPSGINNAGVITNTTGVVKNPFGFTIAPPYATANIKRVIPLYATFSNVYAIDRNGDVAGSSNSNNYATGKAISGFFQLANGTGYSGYDPIHTSYGLGATAAAILGGNSHGLLVGDYTTKDSIIHGFIYRIEDLAADPLLTGSSFEYVPPVGDVDSNRYNVVLTGVNERDEVVGYVYNEAFEVSLIVNGFKTTEFSVPGAVVTAATGINDVGEIVGQYTDYGNFTHGFIYNAGTYGRVDYPGAVATSVMGINDNGDVVGVFSKAGEPAFSHGFLAKNHQ